MNKCEELMEIISKYQEKTIKHQDITVYGYQYNYEHHLVGNVSKYWFGKHLVEEDIAPLNSESLNNNRPGTKKTSTEYIVVHDTTNVNPSSGARAHAKYVKNGGDGTSWHYSVGDDIIMHQIPDDEVAYHAGDGLMVPFSLENTLVIAEGSDPLIEIKDGYYYLNKHKTIIKVPTVFYGYQNDVLVYGSNGILQRKKAPMGAIPGPSGMVLTTDKINDAGILVEIGQDGYYYMGPTYYSAGYDYIANRAGNLHSIGMEMMVNEGSNIFVSWERTAKLIAHLLKDNNLGLSRVKPHHYFSGKPCPMTLRNNQLWNYFLSLVEAEYEVLMNLNNCEIKLLSHSEYLDDLGNLIKEPQVPSDLAYVIRITDKDGNICDKRFVCQFI